MQELWDVHLRNLQHAWRHDVQGLSGKRVGRAVLTPAAGWGLTHRQFVHTP